MSILLGELNRIQNRHRPHIAYVPTEDYLCSRPLVDFDDEAKHIRAAADKLIRYCHTSVPHETSRLPVRVITAYDRYAPEGRYVSKYSNDIPTNIQCMSYYTEPSRVTIGRGHLACMSYAGGRGYPRRRHLYSDEMRDIGDEIKFRSYYSKNVHPSRNDDALLLPTGESEKSSETK